MQRSCPESIQCIWFNASSEVTQVCIPARQCDASHGVKTKSDKCSIVLAAACVMLALKSIKYCSSSAAEELLWQALPLLSYLRVFNCSVGP